MKPHGKEFKQKIKEINEVLSINITTKHRFVTWYRCDGKCRNIESCFFGYVFRACHETLADLNEPKLHRVFCGGTFNKADEPPSDMLQIIMKRNKLIKSSKRSKKATNALDNGKIITLGNKRSSYIVDYVTSDEES